MRHLIFLLVCAVMFLAVSACDRGPGEPYRETREIMGTYVTVTARRGDLPEILVRVAVNEAFAEIERVDRLMSTYKPESELSAVNRNAGVRPVPVSEDTAETVRLALDIARMTGGAFDPTVGPLVRLWSVAAKDAAVPDEGDIRAALGLVDYTQVEVDDTPDGGHTVFVRRKGMSLDLGGVAKGYAADLAVARLKEKGVPGGIVAVAGDLRMFGSRADGSGWRVGIQHPRDKGGMLTRLEVLDMATSTSGDYERFFMKDGVRYHHIINPRTGHSARGLISVSVAADSSSMADPLATALFVLGPGGALEFARAHPEISVLTVSETGEISATGIFRGLELAAVNP